MICMIRAFAAQVHPRQESCSSFPDIPATREGEAHAIVPMPQSGVGDFLGDLASAVRRFLRDMARGVGLLGKSNPSPEQAASWGT